MINCWIHKDWQTAKGVWFIACKLSDTQVTSLIQSNPAKYGNYQDWSKK